MSDKNQTYGSRLLQQSYGISKRTVERLQTPDTGTELPSPIPTWEDLKNNLPGDGYGNLDKNTLAWSSTVGGLVGAAAGFIGAVSYDGVANPPPAADVLYKQPEKSVQAVVRERMEADSSLAHLAPADAYIHGQELEAQETAKRANDKAEALKPIEDCAIKAKRTLGASTAIGALAGASLAIPALATGFGFVDAAKRRREKKEKNKNNPLALE